ncbi:FAD-dependent oxidoreductase [Streptomyces sp. CA-249302]|uniref:FAD-dependent oxidoreductase n=1 Tax=Streptomyces sp. CA-249302 TaxID=3240058 RepID=UPI003D94FFF5
MYGFLVYGEAAVKVRRDMRGRLIRSGDRVFEGDEEGADLLRSFLTRHLPSDVGPTLANRTCVYDMPPDRDFILDTLPDHPHIALFNGAGHAGKFAALIGKILADLLTEGVTTHDISAFSLQRLALTHSEFQPVFRLTS